LIGLLFARLPIPWQTTARQVGSAVCAAAAAAPAAQGSAYNRAMLNNSMGTIDASMKWLNWSQQLFHPHVVVRSSMLCSVVLQWNHSFCCFAVELDWSQWN
jgi:hypothetical protein